MPFSSWHASTVFKFYNLVVFRSKNLRLKQYKVEENQGLNDLNVYASERLHNSKLIKISNTQKHEEVGYLRELSKLYQKVRVI